METSGPLPPTTSTITIFTFSPSVLTSLEDCFPTTESAFESLALESLLRIFKATSIRSRVALARTSKYFARFALVHSSSLLDFSISQVPLSPRDRPLISDPDFMPSYTQHCTLLSPYEKHGKGTKRYFYDPQSNSHDGMMPARLRCKICNWNLEFLVYADEGRVHRWQTSFNGQFYRKHAHNSEQDVKYTKGMMGLIGEGIEIMKDEYENNVKQASFLTLRYRTAAR